MPMKKNALRKEFWVSLRKTKNRFFSILLIVALGVAFFSGIRSTSPDMCLSADRYYDQCSLMDIRILSTLGLTEADLKEISEIQGIKQAVAAYTKDVLCNRGDSQMVLKLMSDTGEVNQVQVADGRKPEGDGECLIDTRLAEEYGYQIGDKIQLLSGEKDEELSDFISTDEFEIVGTGKLSYYMSLERGSSSIGSGTISGFVILPESSFTMDYYTEINATVDGAMDLNCYSQDYKDTIKPVTDRLEDISKERSRVRYEDIREEAEGEIAKAERKIAKAERALEKAGRKLERAEEKLTDGETELEDQKQTLEDGRKEIQEKQKELKDAKKVLKEEEENLKEAISQLASGRLEVEEGKTEIAAAKKELKNGKTQLEAGKKELEAARIEYQTGAAQLEEGKKSAEAGWATYRQQLSDFEAGKEWMSEAERQATEQALEQARLTLEETDKTLASQEKLLKSAEKELKAGEKEWNNQNRELSAGEKELKEQEALIIQAEADLEEAQEQIVEGKAQIQEAKLELEDGEIQLAEGKQEIADGEKEIAKAEKKIEKARTKLEDGKAEYLEEKRKADKKINKGKDEVEQAKADLEALKEPEWYVLDRQSFQTYVEYQHDSDRIAAIGQVFPAIFFLVAALVSLTTMTRMVEEERTQIGTLKALGYKKHQIAAKYLIYGLLASLIGSLIGIVLGEKLLPIVIIQAYKILYNSLPEILTPMNLFYSVTSTLLAVGCTTLAVGFACYKELLAVPAKLMRPQAPKSGKRILLERVTFLWNRIGFTQKATFRNLFRYKKRFFMTIFGIGGCMALLLVGFGLKDSIMSIGTLQFGSIRVYDSAISLQSGAKEKDKKALIEKLEQDETVDQIMYAMEGSLTSAANGVEKEVSYIVPESLEKLPHYVKLQDRTTKEEYQLDDQGVIITEKMASLLKLKPGDSILLKKEETQRVTAKVTAITENYFLNYVYISPNLYEQLYGEKAKYNQILLVQNQEGDAYEEEFQQTYLRQDGISQISFLSATRERVADMLRSMDTIIYVLVIAAGLLALVVLYNLNNINISERKRELATLKVLGFFDGEVSSYVLKENIWLTLIGSACGVGMGILLHRFVILTAEVDSMMFGRQIFNKSYIYSIVLTFLFSMAVNVIMHVSLKKIDMIESLKSVE